MQDLPTATFLLTDIEGSTRLWDRFPSQMQLALADHDALIQVSVERYGGLVIKNTGDGALAVFEQPVAAMRAAVDMQLALTDASATSGLQLRIRCGIHAGTYQRRTSDYFGLALNRTARIAAAAHGGQILLSSALMELVTQDLPENFQLRDMGSVRLRDLGTPERLFQLVHPRLPQQFPPLRSLEITPHNLPAQLNSFVGREQELREVRERVLQERMLTLLGMGGIGKSRLSLQVAAASVGDFPDGVWLVELAPLNDGSLIAPAVANAINLKEEPGFPLIESLVRYFRDKRVLLILDNCEHLTRGCAELVSRLLPSCIHLRILASSRDALQVTGEHIYQVQTLSLPASDRQTSADWLGQDAVRLFVDRATAAQPSFRINEGNASVVADICRRLDGIPLAIELAAARTRALSVNTIAERLGDRFRLLVSGDPTVSPRQRTLRALIDWSYDLLDVEERKLLNRLSVFVGGFTLDSAEELVRCLGLPSEYVIDQLVSLVQKSLLVLDLGSERYRMLDTVRHFAAEHLAAMGESSITRDAQLQLALSLAESARAELAGPKQSEWLKRLDAERDNLIAAHQWSANASQGDDWGLRLMHALRPYWINRGELTFGLRIAEELVRRPGLQRRDDQRCMALFSAGQLSYLTGRYEAAIQYLLECHAVAAENANDAIVARTLQPLGMACLAHRDYEQAARHLRQAVVLARAQAESRDIAAALNALTMLQRMQGRLNEALLSAAEALQLARAADDVEAVGISLLNLLMVLIEQGEFARTRPHLLEVLRLAEPTGSRQIVECALEVVSALASAESHWVLSAQLLGCAEILRKSAALRREPADEAFMKPFVERCREALQGETFEREKGQGGMLSQSQAIALAQAWLEARR